MTIHVEAPKEDTYVRVCPSSIESPAAQFAGRVAKVISESAFHEGRTICIVEIPNENGRKVFDGSELERITRKEYFKEALRG